MTSTVARGVLLEQVVHRGERLLALVVAIDAVDDLDLGVVVGQPLDEVVVAVGRRRRALGPLDLDDLAAVAAQDRLGDVLRGRSADELVVGADVLGDRVDDAAVEGDDRDVGRHGALGRLVQADVGVRRQQQDIDRAGDEFVDVAGLHCVVALRVGDDRLGARVELLAVVADVVVLVGAPLVAAVGLREADDATTRCARGGRAGRRGRCRDRRGRGWGGRCGRAADEDHDRCGDQTRLQDPGHVPCPPCSCSIRPSFSGAVPDGATQPRSSIAALGHGLTCLPPWSWSAAPGGRRRG